MPLTLLNSVCFQFFSFSKFAQSKEGGNKLYDFSPFSLKKKNSKTARKSSKELLLDKIEYLFQKIR